MDIEQLGRYIRFLHDVQEVEMKTVKVDDPVVFLKGLVFGLILGAGMALTLTGMI